MYLLTPLMGLERFGEIDSVPAESFSHWKFGFLLRKENVSHSTFRIVNFDFAFLVAAVLSDFIFS